MNSKHMMAMACVVALCGSVLADDFVSADFSLDWTYYTIKPYTAWHLNFASVMCEVRSARCEVVNTGWAESALTRSVPNRCLQPSAADHNNRA